MPPPIFLFAPGAGAPSSHPWMRHWAKLLREIGRVETLDYCPLNQLESLFVFCHGLDYRNWAGMRFQPQIFGIESYPDRRCSAKLPWLGPDSRDPKHRLG